MKNIKQAEFGRREIEIAEQGTADLADVSFLLIIFRQLGDEVMNGTCVCEQRKLPLSRAATAVAEISVYPVSTFHHLLHLRLV